MPLDSSQLFVAGSGALYVAPVGTTAPTDVTTAWAAAWKDVGYLEEDGASFGVSYDTSTKNSWQSLDPTNYVRTGRASTLKATLKQWNQVNFPIAFGGGTMTETSLGSGIYKYDAPTGASIDYRAVGLQVTDGTKIGRLVIPKVMVTEMDDVAFQRGEEATMGITFGVVATGTAAAFTFLGNLALFPLT